MVNYHQVYRILLTSAKCVSYGRKRSRCETWAGRRNRLSGREERSRSFWTSGSGSRKRLTNSTTASCSWCTCKTNQSPRFPDWSSHVTLCNYLHAGKYNHLMWHYSSQRHSNLRIRSTFPSPLYKPRFSKSLKQLQHCCCTAQCSFLKKIPRKRSYLTWHRHGNWTSEFHYILIYVVPYLLYRWTDTPRLSTTILNT
jgi:hypothetical protein